MSYQSLPRSGGAMHWRRAVKTGVAANFRCPRRRRAKTRHRWSHDRQSVAPIRSQKHWSRCWSDEFAKSRNLRPAAVVASADRPSLAIAVLGPSGHLFSNGHRPQPIQGEFAANTAHRRQTWPRWELSALPPLLRGQRSGQRGQVPRSIGPYHYRYVANSLTVIAKAFGRCECRKEFRLQWIAELPIRHELPRRKAR